MNSEQQALNDLTTELSYAQLGLSNLELENKLFKQAAYISKIVLEKANNFHPMNAEDDTLYKFTEIIKILESEK